MKKPYFAKIFCLSILIILVSSCTGKGFSNGNSSSIFVEMTNKEDIEKIDIDNLKNKEISITIWSASNSKQYNLVNKYINDFKILFPKVNITQLDQGNAEDLDYNLTAAIAAKETPTIAIIDHSYIADYISYNAIEIINPYMDAINTKIENNDRADYISEFWLNGSSFSLDESIYSLPLFNYSNILYYNSTLIKDLNINMDDLNWSNESENSIINIARKIKKTNKSIVPLYIENPISLYKLLTYQSEIPYTKLTGKVDGDFLFTSNEVVSIIQDIKQWIDEGLLVLGKNLNITEGQNPFNDKIAMSIAPNNYYSKYQSSNNVLASMIPQVNKDKTYNEIISEDFIIFKKEPIETKIIAWLFYKFITSKENDITTTLSCSTLPLRYSFFESSSYNDAISNESNNNKLKISSLKLYEDLINNIQAEPSFVGKRVSDKEIGKLLMTISNNDFSSLSLKAREEFIKDCLLEAYKQSVLAQG